MRYALALVLVILFTLPAVRSGCQLRICTPATPAMLDGVRADLGGFGVTDPEPIRVIDDPYEPVPYEEPVRVIDDPGEPVPLELPSHEPMDRDREIREATLG